MTWTKLVSVQFIGAAYCFMVEFQAIQKYFMTTLTEI